MVSMAVPEQSLGPYRLIERIGAGGMGEVWKAEDSRLGRLVAIKIVAPEVATDPEAIVRLRREARMAAQLNHPNIAMIHSIEESDGVLFVVMEFVEGQPLSALIRRGALPEGELCRIGRCVADALAEAHSKSIIHRDIKPDNIIVSGPKVKVLDFGIAKQVGTSGSTSDAPTATFMTQQGMIVGTIQYMSPEQALGKPLDPRTDIFSLGVVLYEAATGRLPFQGETATDTMTRIIRDDPQEAVRVNPAISPALNAVIRRCMRKNREERYATAADLARALELQLGRATTARTAAKPTVLTGSRLQTIQSPKKKSPLGWIAAAIVVLALGAGAVVLRHRNAVVAATASPAATQPKAPAPVTSAPTQTAVTVTAPAQPAATVADVAPPPVPAQTESTPVPVAQSVQPPPQKPRGESARQHFQHGERALLNRNFPKAIEEYQMALDHKENLKDRERALCHLGIAVAMHNRMQAQRLGREIEFRWPGDPDLEMIRDSFAPAGGQQHPFRRRPR